MSDNKKVIHVKDLVIKADNVRIEPAHRPDPFFGRKHPEVEEDTEEEKGKQHKKEDDHEKPPFSWL